MKSRYLTLGLFLLTAIGYGQGSNIIELSDFTELKVYDRITVSLVKSDENKLVITGANKDEVDISEKGALLKIRMELDNFLAGNETKATLYYNEELSLIDANENAKIISDETYQGKKTIIRGQEGAVIALDVAVDYVDVRAISGSEITLTGRSTEQEIAVNTGGRVYNEDFNTQHTIATVLAGGRANVKASSKVVAKVKAGGAIYIYGNPKNIEKNKVFGGKINVME